MPTSAELSLPRRLAVALYGAAQAQPTAVVRGRVVAARDGLELQHEGAAAAGPVFAAFRSQPEVGPAPDAAELGHLLELAPRVLVVSRATRGVMVLTGFQRGAGGEIEALPVRIEDPEQQPV